MAQGTWHPEPGTRNPAPGTWHKEPGTRMTLEATRGHIEPVEMCLIELVEMCAKGAGG